MFHKIKHHPTHPSVLLPKDIATCSGCCTKLINLSVQYGETKILDNINLHFHCGELTVLVGPNGAGKSTLFKALLSEIPFKGELCFHEASGGQISRPRVGYVPQKLDFDTSSPMTVRDLFSFSLPKLSTTQIKEALTKTEVEHLFHKRLGVLSGGEMQRTLLALALTPLPEILLLDEPISGMDLKGVNLFYKMVSTLRMNYDLSILLVSHDLAAVAPYADRMILLNRKILCDGTPGEVMNHEELKKLLGNGGAYVGL